LGNSKEAGNSLVTGMDCHYEHARKNPSREFQIYDQIKAKDFEKSKFMELNPGFAFSFSDFLRPRAHPSAVQMDLVEIWAKNEFSFQTNKRANNGKRKEYKPNSNPTFAEAISLAWLIFLTTSMSLSGLMMTPLISSRCSKVVYP